MASEFTPFLDLGLAIRTPRTGQINLSLALQALMLGGRKKNGACFGR
jgi:hypothetical protein